MSNHTPEPWTLIKRQGADDALCVTIEPNGRQRILASIPLWKGEEGTSNAARIVSCVNGCAGLNPAAYRAVVEALRSLVIGMDERAGTKELTKRWHTAQHALAQETP